MTPVGADVRILRFAAFELDLRQEELRRAGVLIKLSPQQFRVLRYLAERSGEVASRDQIRREIWGSDVFVDFDRGLNVSIAQIRAALNDDSESPRFIQTVPRRGYRFVAPVEVVTDVTNTPAAAPRRMPARGIYAKVGIAIAIVGLAVGVVRLRMEPPTPARIVLAVLPFENVTRAAEDATTIDGLTDELISQFGTALPQRIAVIGKTSVARLAAQRAALPQIGRDLAASYVMEGDLRSEGGRVRVSARLVKVSDQAQVWSETYELDGSSRLQMEEDLAARVTAGAISALFPQAALSKPHVPSRAAYDAFVNGRTLQRSRSLADIRRSLDFFEAAGQRDPAYPDPWAAMAASYVTLALAGNSPEFLDRARPAAERALRLSETNAEAHNALGDVLTWRDWRAAEAGAHFLRALALNPSFAHARHDYAFLLIVTGHAEAGVAELRRAIALDPLSPRVNVDAGWLLLQAHRYRDALAAAKRALALDPGLREAEACIARAEFLLGDGRTESVAFYRSQLASPDPFQRALALAVNGRKSDVLAALRDALAARDLQMTMIATEPAFAAWHADPAFRDLIAKVWGNALSPSSAGVQ